VNVWPPIPEGDLPDTRPKGGGPHHIGLTVSQGRAIAVASELFPDEVSIGHECVPGCLFCAERNRLWADRVRQVRRAMIKAFS
jgi:hypothetical protein